MNWLSNQNLVNELRIENALWPDHLVKIPRGKWPSVRIPPNLREVWRSRSYLAQIFQEDYGIERISICISDVNVLGERWKDGLGWEDLQEIKRQVGRGNRDAVEVFPKDVDVVNVANMRHLWVMRDDIPYAWRKKDKTI